MLLLQRGFHIPVCCPLPGIPISQVQEKYGAPLLLEALESFFATNVALRHHRRAHAFDRLVVYKYMTILSPLKQHMSDTKWFFKLCATPSCPVSHNSRKGPSPAVFNSALFFKQSDPNTMRFESEGNPSSLARPEGLFDSVKIGLQIGQIKVIFNIGPLLGKTRYPLVYVHWFCPIQSIDHAMRMFSVVPSSWQHGPNVEVIPVNRKC